MDIRTVIDGLLQSDASRSGSEEDRKRIACELLLNELKDSTAEELLPYFRSMDLKKAERQMVVTLSFPWEVSYSNFLGNMQDRDS